MKKVNFFPTILFLGLLAVLVSCSTEPEKTEAEKNREKLEESMDELKGNLEDIGEDLKNAGKDVSGDLEKAFNDLGESIKDMNVSKDGEKVETISFRDLKKQMPSTLAGLDQTETSGETTGAFGVKISTATGFYEEGDQRLELKITDTGGVGLAMMGMAAWSKIEVDRESKTEIEYTTTIEGFKAFVKYNKKSKKGEYNIILEDRFIVQLESRNMEMDDLENAAKDLGLKRLARKLG